MIAVMQIFDQIINDRGSKYAVSGGVVKTKEDAQAMVKTLKKEKRFARATHNTWGVILSDGGAIKNDDGEGGAGMVIIRMLERVDLKDHLIIVTRWFGGTQLGGDCFRRVQDSVAYYLDHYQDQPSS
jgi:putative IMPACT (imprinted ancient) family translation regulator